MSKKAPKLPAPLPRDEGAIVPAGRGEILLYQTDDGRIRIECRFRDDTIWLSQAMMAELFQKDVRTINDHLRNLYEEGELEPGATIRQYRIVRREGGREVEREIEHYNLDAISGLVFMKDWEQRLNEFLQFNDRNVLTHAGGVSKADADAFAQEQYDRFADRRRIFKEAEGERDAIKALEDAARKLPDRTSDHRKDGAHGS